MNIAASYLRYVLTIAAVLWLPGCATAVATGAGGGGYGADGRSYEEARSDNKITAAVNSLLVKDQRVRAMDIRVHTFDGIVTLSGNVPDRNSASIVETLARGVNGVRGVDNRLSIGH